MIYPEDSAIHPSNNWGQVISVSEDQNPTEPNYNNLVNKRGSFTIRKMMFPFVRANDSKRYKYSKHQASVVRRVDSAIHRINHYPLDNSIGSASVYPLDSDLSGG